MDSIEFSNFLLGLRARASEEVLALGNNFSNFYDEILAAGTNNNSETAVLIREATDTVVIILEDLINNHRYN